MLVDPPGRPQLTGAQRRKARVAKGLPRYTEAEALSRKRHEALRGPLRRARSYAHRRMLIDTIKTERGCTDCGYRAHPAALDFDHLPGSTKRGAVSGLMTRLSEPDLLAEIGKCEVVCANCHRVRTVSRRADAGPALYHGALLPREPRAPGRWWTPSNLVLDEEKVRAIRARRAQGEGKRKLAAEYGVTPMTIHHVTTYKTWRHVR